MKKLTVRGSWFEMGRQVGVAQKEIVNKMMKWVIITPKYARLAEKQIAFLSKTAARELEFIRGLADGTGQTLNVMVAFMSWQDRILLGLRCSTVLGVDRGQWFVAHNEDYDDRLRDTLYLLRCEPTDGVPFTAIQYAGTLPGDALGVNNQGFATFINTIHKKVMPARVGWSVHVTGFQLMQCASWAEVKKVYDHIRPSAGGHVLVVERSKKAMSMELFPDAKDRLWVKPGFIHTNHALLPKARLKATASRSSRRRFKALSRLKKPASLREALACLRTPVQHGGARTETQKNHLATLATVVIKPASHRIEIEK